MIVAHHFLIRSLRYLNGRTLSPFPAEAPHDRPNQSRKVYSGLDREKPEIIEIPRFIPRRIRKSDDLLGRDFVQTADCDRTVFGQVFEFRIGT